MRRSNGRLSLRPLRTDDSSDAKRISSWSVILVHSRPTFSASENMVIFLVMLTFSGIAFMAFPGIWVGHLSDGEEKRQSTKVARWCGLLLFSLAALTLVRSEWIELQTPILRYSIVGLTILLFSTSILLFVRFCLLPEDSSEGYLGAPYKKKLLLTLLVLSSIAVLVFACNYVYSTEWAEQHRLMIDRCVAFFGRSVMLLLSLSMTWLSLFRPALLWRYWRIPEPRKDLRLSLYFGGIVCLFVAIIMSLLLLGIGTQK